MLSKKIQVLADTVKKLLSCHAEENLKNILAKAHAADIASVLAELSLDQQTKTFLLLKGLEQQAQVLSELSVNQVAPLLKNLGALKSAEVLGQASPQYVVDMMESLDDAFSSEILLLLKKEEAEEVEDLIRYRPDSAGGIMSPDVFFLSEESTAQQAIKQIQKASKTQHLFYLYVVNPQQQLVGVLSLKKLILAPPTSILKDIMDKDPIRVRLEEDQEEVARIVSRYNYLAIPVVDDTNQLMGVITVDDIIDVIKEEAAEDMLAMGGVEAQAQSQISWLAGLKKRGPFFLVTFFGGLIASEILNAFFSQQPKNILIGFIPMILSMGSLAGTQSMTVVVSSLTGEALAGGGFRFKQFGAIFLKEFRLGGLLGMIYGSLLGIFIHYRFHLSAFFSMAIGLAFLLVLLIAVFVGVMIPYLFKKAGIDPAKATTPFVTALVSVFCVWAYMVFTVYAASL